MYATVPTRTHLGILISRGAPSHGLTMKFMGRPLLHLPVTNVLDFPVVTDETSPLGCCEAVIL